MYYEPIRDNEYSMACLQEHWIWLMKSKKTRMVYVAKKMCTKFRTIVRDVKDYLSRFDCSVQKHFPLNKEKNNST